MSDEEFAAFKDPVWEEMFKECASEKLIELENKRRLYDEGDREIAKRHAKDAFFLKLLASANVFFQKDLAHEKLKWFTFKKPPPPKGSYDLDALRKVPLLSLHAFEKLRDTEQRAVARCPFHEEKTASFVIFKEDNHYYCFGCQARGNAIDFLMNRDEISFKKACEMLSACG